MWKRLIANRMFDYKIRQLYTKVRARTGVTSHVFCDTCEHWDTRVMSCRLPTEERFLKNSLCRRTINHLLLTYNNSNNR